MQKYQNRLKQLEKERNIDVQELLNFTNISLSYYYQLKRGEKRLNEDTLNLFADFYGVSADYILGRVEGKKEMLLQGDSLPEELRGYTDAIISAKKDFTPEELQKIIEAAKMIKGIK